MRTVVRGIVLLVAWVSIGAAIAGFFMPWVSLDVKARHLADQVGGQLGQFVPAFYQPGDYQFRLTVFDITTALKAACTVNITISPPIPTLTPIRQP